MVLQWPEFPQVHYTGVLIHFRHTNCSVLCYVILHTNGATTTAGISTVCKLLLPKKHHCFLGTTEVHYYRGSLLEGVLFIQDVSL